MAENIIRSHRARVRQSNETLKNNPRYHGQHISVFDREAFVGFYLLEDIVRLYNRYLEWANDPGSGINGQNVRAVIDLFNAAIKLAYFAIESGDYQKVWKVIEQKRLMAAAKSVKKMPILIELGVKLLRELSKALAEALDVREKRDENPDDLDANDFKNEWLLPTADEIEEVIRVAEERKKRMEQGRNRFQK